MAGKISVGPPYFDSVFGPLMVPVIVLMGVGPLIRWKDASIVDVCKRVAWCAIAAVVLGAAIPLYKGWGYLDIRRSDNVFLGIVHLHRISA